MGVHSASIGPVVNLLTHHNTSTSTHFNVYQSLLPSQAYDLYDLLELDQVQVITKFMEPDFLVNLTIQSYFWQERQYSGFLTPPAGSLDIVTFSCVESDVS